MAVIDLSQLPAPQIVDVPDFETLLAERKAEFVALHPKDEQEAVIRTLELESEPVTKLLQENAYRELLLRQRINEAAQAVMVAYAMGGDLDQIAANYNVKRLTVTPADDDAVPPVAAVMESDEALRLRVPAAFEGLSVAGPTAAYEFHARSADGRVADASATSPAPAEVVLTVLSREGDGTAEKDLLDVVEKALNSENVRPVADRLTVRSAEIIPYRVEATIFLYPGPEAEPVMAAAKQVIPENEGGWWIREVGLFDESGALIAVGNCPESYKPQLVEGSGRTQTVRMVLITSSTDNITLKIDPAVVLATRKYVDDKIGALLSPIGLVVTALAGVALVVWKYWQPITAFLAGVVEGFKAAAGPISAAFEPLKPVFQWIGDKVQALWGWFTDLLTPVKSTSAELQSAAAMGRRFGEALAEGLNMVMHPLDSLKSGVSWLLDKLGIVSKEAAKAKLPESVTRQQPATVNADGKVMMPSGGFPSWGYGFAGMYDSGGYIPRGQFGIVGENGPEIVNGPANVTSRRNTAALAAVVAGMMGVAAAPAELPPLHPLALPAKGGEAMVSRAATVPPVHRIEAPTQIIIQTQPGQSAQDIAREVARQLDERERRLKAKARSNYSDQGGYDA